MFRYLGEHPQVYTPRHHKEPHYFSTDFPDHTYSRSLDEYLGLFAAAKPLHRAVGEASVWYLYSREAIANIREFAPDARLIAMLRNPVDLVPSLHSQHLYVEVEDQADFETAWRMQDRRRLGGNIPPTCREPALLQYGAIGRLGEQVERMLDLFPRDQVRLILFDDFVSATRRVYEDTLRFLDLDPDDRTEFRRVNPNKTVRSDRLGRFIRRPPAALDRARVAIKRFLGVRSTGLGRMMLRANRKTVARAPLDPAVRDELRDWFRDDVARLSSILDRDLSGWIESRPAPRG
jgi:hypothetical protein